MVAVVFSIKPEFADKIFSGEKRFEYRKKLLGRIDINKAIIYCTAPVSKIIGEAKIRSIITGTPDIIWDKTHNHSGISKETYDKYFCRSKQGVAYELFDVIKYKKAKTLDEIGLTTAPQSFAYFNLDG